MPVLTSKLNPRSEAFKDSAGLMRTLVDELNARLAQVALGYAPMIDRQRMVSALRLTVFPLRPEAP